MIIKAYTESHDLEKLDKIQLDEIFSAQEHTIHYQAQKRFLNKDNLLRKVLAEDFNKLSSLSLLIDTCYRNNFKNILSIGSGFCVNEYLLKKALPEDTNVVASDFDPYLIQKSNDFFPELVSIEFNMIEDSFLNLQNQLNIKFDLVYFMGSSYVLDDNQFIKFFKDIKHSGVKKVIDFSVCNLSLIDILSYYLRPIRQNEKIRKLFKKDKIKRKKAHGYHRDNRHILNLYKKSNFQLEKKQNRKLIH